MNYICQPKNFETKSAIKRKLWELPFSLSLQIKSQEKVCSHSPFYWCTFLNWRFGNYVVLDPSTFPPKHFQQWRTELSRAQPCCYNFFIRVQGLRGGVKMCGISVIISGIRIDLSSLIPDYIPPSPQPPQQVNLQPFMFGFTIFK